MKGSDMTVLPARTEVLCLGDGDLAALTRQLGAFTGGLTGGTAVLDLRATTARRGSVAIDEVTRWERAMRGLERSVAASIAVLGSVTHGPALELALACDLRIASADTRLVVRDEDGVWPGTTLYRLVHLLGLGTTRRLLLIDDSWHAAKALDAGLVDRVADDPWPAVESLAARVREVGDLRVVRQLIGEASFTSYDEALGGHLAACDRFIRRRDAD